MAYTNIGVGSDKDENIKGKCWMHDGKYMGKLIRIELEGPIFQMTLVGIFENGIIKEDLGTIKCIEVPCKVGGGLRNNRMNACYDAIKEGEKFVCPVCRAKEGGSSRMITHNWNCPNKGKVYCQQPPLPAGVKQYGARRRTLRKKSALRIKRTRTQTRVRR